MEIELLEIVAAKRHLRDLMSVVGSESTRTVLKQTVVFYLVET